MFQSFPPFPFLQKIHHVLVGTNQEISFYVTHLYHMAKAPDNLDSYRFRRIEISRTAADITRTELDLMKSLA